VSTWRDSPQELWLSPETVVQGSLDRNEEEEVYQDTEESDVTSVKKGACLFDAVNYIPIDKLQISELDTDEHIVIRFDIEQQDIDEHIVIKSIPDEQDIDEHKFEVSNSEIANSQHNSNDDEIDIDDQTDQHSSSSSSVDGASLQTSPRTIKEYRDEIAHLYKVKKEQEVEFDKLEVYLTEVRGNIIAAEQQINRQARNIDSLESRHQDDQRELRKKKNRDFKSSNKSIKRAGYASARVYRFDGR